MQTVLHRQSKIQDDTAVPNKETREKKHKHLNATTAAAADIYTSPSSLTVRKKHEHYLTQTPQKEKKIEN